MVLADLVVKDNLSLNRHCQHNNPFLHIRPSNSSEATLKGPILLPKQITQENSIVEQNLKSLGNFPNVNSDSNRNCAKKDQQWPKFTANDFQD